MSTRRKSSRSNIKKLAEPALAGSYRNAISAFCGASIQISEKDHPKFRARQTDLDGIDAAYDTYAYTVVKSWWPWCKKQGWRTVTVGIFCGKKAWARFTKSYVRIESAAEDSWNILVHAEVMAARMYIGAQISKNSLPISQARRLARSDPTDEIVSETLKLLNLVFDMNEPNYDAIIKCILGRRNRNAGLIRV